MLSTRRVQGLSGSVGPQDKRSDFHEAALCWISLGVSLVCTLVLLALAVCYSLGSLTLVHWEACKGRSAQGLWTQSGRARFQSCGVFSRRD